ncbi:MAG: transposase [Oscillospiraceae bacterium]|nr:transposase [Oscillospiraceae bacterium]MBR6923645.1 transposase [Oscillospiraceae bacterium]
MSRRRKLTDEERIQAVQKYLNGEGSYSSISKEYGIDHKQLRMLVSRAQAEGIDSIKKRHTNRKYTTETKLAAVQEYLAGKGSQMRICQKYHITNDSLLRNWISLYNSGEDFNERTCSGRGITMNKGRKTTQEERVEIVAFCIENGKDYGITMEKYGVSYQQIYSWVRKYESKGVKGLTDRRGKAKPEDELNEADKLRMENKILQAKIKDQEMEIKLLKKLRELEGGDW